VLCGYAYAEIGMRFRKTPIPLWRSEVVWNLTQLAAVGIALVGCSLLAGPFLAAAAVLASFLLLVARKAWQMRNSDQDRLSILTYAFHTYLVKVPLWAGHLRYFLDRLRGRTRTAKATVLSEWKRAE